MIILISGGNFINKGAEAMLFASFVECKNMFADAQFILQLPNGFRKVNKIEDLVRLSNNNGKVVENHMGGVLKLKSLYTAYKQADIMLDVSGLELCSKLGVYPSLRYIFKIAISKWLGTKVFLMPQSFGPFNYGKGLKQWFMKTLIQHYISYPKICYARESEGFDALRALNPQAHVLLSSDLVLQNKSVEALLKRDDMGFDKLPHIRKRSVGFVPNKRMYEQYGKEKPLTCYKNIIQKLRQENYNVYILCHANDDLSVAEELKSFYSQDDGVCIVNQVLSCFQYQTLVKDFDFVVASRYHSIVHAYKENVPVIALGWAVKYKELLSRVQQNQYLLKLDDSETTIHDKIDDIILKHNEDSQMIKSCMREVQSNNCFLTIKEYVL